MCCAIVLTSKTHIHADNDPNHNDPHIRKALRILTLAYLNVIKVTVIMLSAVLVKAVMLIIILFTSRGTLINQEC